MTVEFTAPQGALCSVHPDRTAQRVCSRCGNFICHECAAAGPHCPACVALYGATPFPFTREAHEFGTVAQYVYEAFKKDAVMLILASAIVLGVGFTANVMSRLVTTFGGLLMGDNPVAAMVVIGGGAVMSIVLQLLAQGLVQLGFTQVAIDVLNGRKADLGRLFSQLKRFAQFAIQQLVLVLGIVVVLAVLIGAAVGVGFALGLSVKGTSKPEVAVILGALMLTAVVIAGSIWLSPALFAPLELVYGGGTGLDALRRAFVIGEGHRFEIAGYVLISMVLGFAAVFLGLVTLCVGLLVTIPTWHALQHLLLTAKYLALRQECPGLPPPERSG